MFARFAIQVALQYELDARQMPANWTTGYWAYGTDSPGKRPTEFCASTSSALAFLP